MSNKEPSNLLSIKNLTVQYGNRFLYNNFSIDFKCGEFVSIMGTSGSGKSTLFKSILDTKNTSFDIFWRDKLWNRRDIGYRIGFAPQYGGLFSDMTIGQNLSMPLIYLLNTGVELAAQFSYMRMLRFNLDEGVFYQYPYMLSGGMIKRAMVCFATMVDQDLILLDEPLSGLDKVIAGNLIDLLKGLKKTIICVTHDFICSDRYLILQNESKFLGTLEQVYKDKTAGDFMRKFHKKEN